jgi:hypothetical protein
MTTEMLSDEVVSGRSVMSYMTPEDGDVEVSWTIGNLDEVETARATFDRLHGKGYLAYRTSGRGSRAQRDQIREFDPQAGRITMVPPLAGG